MKFSELSPERKDAFARSFVHAVMERVEENLYKKTLEVMTRCPELRVGDAIEISYNLKLDADSIARFLESESSVPMFVDVETIGRKQ